MSGEVLMDETQAYIEKMEALIHNRLEGISDQPEQENEMVENVPRKVSTDSGVSNSAKEVEAESVPANIPTIEIDQDHVSAPPDEENGDKGPTYAYEPSTDAVCSIVDPDTKAAEDYYREQGYDESKKEVLETFDEPEEEVLETFAARAGIADTPASAPRNDDGYDYSASEDAAESGLIRAKSPLQYYKDEGYDAVIAEMAAAKIAAAKDDDEKSSRRSSVASQVHEAPLSRAGSVTSKKSSRRGSTTSQVIEEGNLSRTGSTRASVKSSRRQSSASVAEQEIPAALSRQGSVTSRHSSVKGVSSRRESTASLVGRESVGSRKASVSSRRDSTGTLVPDEEVTSRRGSQASIVNGVSAVVNGVEAVESRRGSIVSRRESNASAVANGDEPTTSRRGSVASRRDSTASARVNGDASRRSSIASNKEEVTSRRSSKVSLPAEPPVPSPRSLPPDHSQEEENVFEERVRNSIREYRSEKSMSNSEVLFKIGNDESEGPSADVKALLAWAKGTRKPDTDTMVIRKKQHVEKIKRASDFSLAAVFLATKEPIKEEEPEVAVIIPEKKEKAKPEVKAKDDLIRGHEVESLARQCISGSIIVSNININNIDENNASVTFDGEVDGAQKQVAWDVQRSSAVENQARVAETIRFLDDSVSGTKLKLANLSKILHSDSKLTIVDSSDDYKSLDIETPLDEMHLKVGMKALAKLHAYTFLQFDRNPGLSSKFSKASYTDGQQRNFVKADLENKMVAIAAVLDNIGEEMLVNNVNNLKGNVFNIFREANTSPSVMPCLAHGMPTLANMEFKYFDSMPIDARFKNFDSSNYGSGIPDLHTFINTSGENVAREDFLLRFVYYETLASILKSQGTKIGFSYDDMKTEFVQKRLHGYLHSAAILAGTTDVVVKEEVAPSPVQVLPKMPVAPGPMRPVESKILGTFKPALGAKIMAVNAIQEVPAKKQVVKAAATNGNNKDDIKFPADRIASMMQKAVKVY